MLLKMYSFNKINNSKIICKMKRKKKQLKSTYLFCPIVSKSFTTIPREDEKSSGIPLKSNSRICPQKSYENKKAVQKKSENIIRCTSTKHWVIIFTNNNLVNYSIL